MAGAEGWLDTQNEEGGGTFQKEAACVQQEGARKHKGRREIRVARGSREGLSGSSWMSQRPRWRAS